MYKTGLSLRQNGKQKNISHTISHLKQTHMTTDSVKYRLITGRIKKANAHEDNLLVRFARRKTISTSCLQDQRYIITPE